jgi:tetratricopeptide (TPR) repeat protein
VRSAAALVLLVFATGACTSTEESAAVALELRAAELDPALAEILASARACLEAGDVSGAETRYASLAATYPEDAWLAILLQEARFVALGVDREELAVNLRRSYRAVADGEPTALRLVLAARAEGDAYAALYLAQRALAIDAEFAWGHYAEASAHAQLGRTAEARAAAERAVGVDASLLPAWRLLAWLRSQAGERDAAILIWQAWLAAAEADPRVAPEARVTARCDLGVLLMRSKRYEETLALLGSAPSDATGRSSSVFAAAAVEVGDVEGALVAVRRARERDPEHLLYMVQEALLLERQSAHSAEAHEAWELIIESTQEATDLGALLQRTRAEAHLSRMAHEDSARRSGAAGGDG